MLRKASYLLAAQVLVTCGRGGERIPSDKQTAAEHLAAWESYFVRYFRYHAQEGLNVEQSAPGYNEATLSEYISVYDCSTNASVVLGAHDYLQLYHLDLAFELTGTQRGGAKTRCYHGRYSDVGSAGVGHAMSWLYGWHDQSVIGPPFGDVVTDPGWAAYQATSDWRPLPVITAIAKRSGKQKLASPLWWRSRRLGAGVGCSGCPASNAVRPDGAPTPCKTVCNCQGAPPTTAAGYNVSSGLPVGEGICYSMSQGLGRGEPDADGGLLHSTFIGAGFSLASLTRDYSKNFSALSTQNQWMGAALASGPDERVHLLGNGSIVNKQWTVSSYEFNAVQHKAAFVAARPSSTKTNYGPSSQDCLLHPGRESWCGTTGSEIFFTASLWARVVRKSVSGVEWLCVDSTDSDKRSPPGSFAGAYLCVGIVNGGFTVSNTTQLPLAPGGTTSQTGPLIVLQDKSSPVVFQAAETHEFTTLAQFVAAVTALPLTHDAETAKVNYTSLDGTVLGIEVDGVAAPTINGETVDLRPSAMPLYEAPPFLSAEWGTTRFEIKAAGLVGSDGKAVADAVLDFSGSWKH